MKKDQGFTLIELLGVIIILAVIALIIIPVVTGYIESSKKKAFINSVYHSMQSIDEDLASQDFAKFPEEGISAKDGLVNIERNPFIGGKYILKNKKMYADRVTDGRYCAVGEKESLKVVLGDCYLLDETAPIVDSVVAGMVTSNSIQVVVNAKDEESDIVSYEYSKDNGKTYTSKQTSNRYTFTNLTHDTSFNIVVRVTNENKLTSSKSVTLKTLLINTPTFASSPGLGSWSKSKVVTVTYPGTKQSNFVYEYRKDNGTWIEVSGTSQNVTFTANGTIEARVRDGYNVVNAATLTLTTIDTSAPGVPTSVIRYDSSSGTVRGNSSSWTNRTLWWGNFSVADAGGSGINHYEYSQNCTGSKSGDLSSSHTYASNTNYTFCIRAVDNAGNIGPWSSAYYFKVDKVNPTCGTISASGTTGSNGWYRSNVTVSKTDGKDDYSGHAGTTISHSSITAEGQTTVTLTTRDNAGNSCSTSKVVSIDKTAPTCSVSGGSTTWTNGNRTITGTPTSCGASGCGSAVSKTISQTAKTASPGTVYDKAGNSVTCPSTNVYVDKTPPTVSISMKLQDVISGSVTSTNYSSGSTTYKFVNVGQSSSDSHSGIKSVTITVTGASTNGTFNVPRSIQANGTSYVYLTATDNAGNTAKTSTYTIVRNNGSGHTHRWKTRGDVKHSVSSWTCTRGHTHTNAYYVFCSDCGLRGSSSNSAGYSYICTTNPYGTADGWTIWSGK